MRYCRRKALARMVRERREEIAEDKRFDEECKRALANIKSRPLGTVQETQRLVDDISRAVEEKRHRPEEDGPNVLDVVALGLAIADVFTDVGSSDGGSSSPDWSGDGGGFSGGGASGEW